MASHLASPEHEVVYQDLVQLVRKHADKISSVEILAIAANMLGKILAMQDQRTMTKEKAMKVVAANIELGNQQVINQLLTESAGTA